MDTSAKDRKRERIEARVNSATKDTIVRAATMQGLSVSDFIVRAAFETAQSVLETQTIIRLSAPDSTAFITAIDNPPEPNAELRRAMNEYADEIAGSSE